MKNIISWAVLLLPALILVLYTHTTAYGQTPSDAVLMNKGEICVAAIYGHESWSEYWEGTRKRDNGNIGTFTRQSIMPMFALGIANKINVIAGLPWVTTQASQGQMRGVSGIQDASLWIKAKAWEHKLGNGAINLHLSVGGALPINNYLADYMPFSLGLGCPDAIFRPILQYQNGGWFARAQGGFHLRGNTTIERDYYYTNQGIYSNIVDMPNAIDYSVVAGYWNGSHTLKAEVAFDALNTLGGFDIRRQDGGFPSNKMNFARIGGGLQYYPAKGKGLGVLASGNYILTGRNVGQSLTVSVGVTYQFAVWH